MKSMLLGLWFCLLLVGCGDHERAATPGEPRTGGLAIVALDADPRTFNPVRMTTAQSSRVFAMLQPGLVRLDPDTGDWQPGLATGWTVAEDGMRVTLTLDSSLRWSDGTSFSADDVVASFDLYRDPEVAYPQRARLDPIEEVVATDAETVRIEFASAPGDPIALLAHIVLPAHVIESLDRDDPAGWSVGRAPVTLGHYRLASWDQDDRLLLERNPHHPAPPARLDRIEIVVVPDAAVRALQLRTGEADLVAALPVNQAADLEEEADVEIERVFGRSVAFLQYDLGDPVVGDVRVRRAIDLAVDRDAVVRGVLFGHARAAGTFLPPVSWAHDGSLDPTPRDLDRARVLLEDAGFVARGDGVRERDGEPLRIRMLTVVGDPIREAVASSIRAQLEEVGIEILLRPIELASLVRAVRSDDFQMMFAQLSGPLDADVRPFFRSDGRFNFGGFSDPRFDEWADVAVNATDRAEALEAARSMQELLVEQQIVTPLYFPATLVAHRARLRGIAPTWLTPFASAEQWWVVDAPAP